MITMLQLFKTAVSQGASDLHVLSESPPVLRVNSRISRIDHPSLTSEQTKELCFSIIE